MTALDDGVMRVVGGTGTASPEPTEDPLPPSCACMGYAIGPEGPVVVATRSRPWYSSSAYWSSRLPSTSPDPR